MPRVELTFAADRDLDNIYDCTLREFGERQANRYLQALGDRLELLARLPNPRP
jgi:plasmid stabilization system protein ParE